MSADARAIARALEVAAAIARTMGAARIAQTALEDLSRHVGPPGDWGESTPLSIALTDLHCAAAWVAHAALRLSEAPSHRTVAHALVGEEIAP